MAAAGDVSTCQLGYRWWSCSFGGQYFTGCCAIDACHQTPVGCPGYVQQPPATTTARHTSATSSNSATTSSGLSSSSIVTNTADPAPTHTPDSPTQTNAPSVGPEAGVASNNNGILIPVPALVVLVVGCFLLVVFAALLLCMRWGRQQRRRDQQRELAAGLAGLAAIPRGEGEISPVAPGNSAHIVGDMRVGDRDMEDISSVGSPMAASHEFRPDLSPNLSELDSSPIHGELDSVVVPTHGLADLQELERRPSEIPRATLSSADSNTYATSWTRFGHVQL
ncbi:hypothetical protein B0H67DRAFT_41166 [Lasiosphaeris hirsuta]|uniref:Uncharacterized protein n=1 Tax=Lasiosphaeris hirsuta TaxID=260670 RepID=A0AA40BAK1_9PEZI|nr:hypothetical protein B0H67DRAFT_41166 [Lasiosphaeris hirsuta]